MSSANVLLRYSVRSVVHPESSKVCLLPTDLVHIDLSLRRLVCILLVLISDAWPKHCLAWRTNLSTLGCSEPEQTVPVAGLGVSLHSCVLGLQTFLAMGVLPVISAIF